LVAFSAATASRVVLARGRRVCNIDTYAKADYKQFNYKKTILAGGKSSIAKGGCQLTALTNIANDRSRSNVNPAQANLILARTPFIRSKTGDVCVPVSASCPKGTPTVLPAREIINGDVEGDAAAALTQALGGPRLNTFFVDVDVPINKKTGVFQGAVPVLDSFLQNALSPVADFFACNHEPVVLRVPNCGTKCTQHFVLGKGKGTIQLAGQPNPNLTEFINDPGSSTITDLLQKGADGKGRHNTTFGLRAPTAASVPGATATHGGMVINVDSPLDVVVVDPLGRKFGTDPQSGQSFLDIENAEFLDDTIVDPDGVALQADTQTLVIGGPADAYGNVTGSGDGILDGTYTLQMTGTGAGPYKVSIQTTDVAGNGKTRYLIGTTAPGQYVEAYLARSSTVGSPFTVTTNTVPQRIPGDVVLDGVVNIDDVQAIFAAAGTPADGADDPMDLDADGQITVLDARKAALLCSKPQCAR